MKENTRVEIELIANEGYNPAKLWPKHQSIGKRSNRMNVSLILDIMVNLVETRVLKENKLTSN